MAMLVRDKGRGEKAAEEISLAFPGASLSVIQCDLGDLDGLPGTVDEIVGLGDGFRVLVNNAGVLTRERRETAQGFEQQFGVNHLGHFALTLRLMERFGVDGWRIVVVSSRAHFGPPLDLDALDPSVGVKGPYSRLRAYQQSKLANTQFMFSLARRLPMDRSTVVATHPGAINTGLLGDYSGKVSFIRHLFRRPASTGGWLADLALDPGLRSLHGVYLDQARPSVASPEAQDETAQEALWAKSLEWTGTTWPRH